MIKEKQNRDWGPIHELDEEGAPPLPYPIEALPQTIRDAVKEYHQYGQQPIEVIASSALASCAVCTQGLADVARDEHLRGPISLSFLVIAESGERKSSADKVFSAPIRRFETAEIAKIAAATEEFKAAQSGHSAERTALIGEIKKSTVNGETEKASELKQTLSELEQSISLPNQSGSILYEDITQEGLASALQHGAKTAAIWSDEAGLILGSPAMSKESKLKFSGFLNRLWDGEDYRSIRKVSSDISIQDVRLSCNMMLQPGIANQLLSAEDSTFRDIGAFARFLVCKPASQIGNRNYRPGAVSRKHILRLQQKQTSLLNKLSSFTDRQLLHLGPEAFKKWVAIHDKAEEAMRRGGKYEHIRDFASKAPENVARLAAVFHIIDGEQGTDISIVYVDAAAKIVRWHLHEALRIFPSLEAELLFQDARLLLKWLIENCVERVAVNRISQMGPNRIRPKDRRNRAIRILEQYNHIRVVREDKVFIELHPQLLGRP